MKISLISMDNTVGLSRDVKLLTELLTSMGHEVTFCEFGFKKEQPKVKADINIFVELVGSSYFGHAKINIIIPNPEWYDLRWRQFLPKFSYILCKTKSAVNAFSTLNRRCKYISFTSTDRYCPDYKKDDNQWLHVAGKSGQKATDIVYETWANNPDFPHLTILQDPIKAKERKPLPNLKLLYEHITENELMRLQNVCGVHVCPSEVEGFGHYIMEAMSAKAIVITTDAPPMNELVQSERGILCKWDRKERLRFANSYYVTTTNLAEAVKKTIALDENERNQIRDRARAFYQSNDANFRQLFAESMAEIIHLYFRTDMPAKRRLGNSLRF